MKNTLYTLGALALAVSIMPLAAFAHSDDGTGVGASVSVEVTSTDAGRDVPSGKASGLTTDGSGSSETEGVTQRNETNIDFTAKSGGDAGTGGDDDSMMMGDDDGDMMDDHGAGMMDDDADDSEHGNEVSAHAVEVRGWDSEKKQEFLSTVKAHAEVKSGHDLEDFAKGVLLKDENVESVSLNFGEIKVEYKADGKLLGFIPHRFTERVTVDTQAEAQDRVKVRFPWYRFLLSIDASAKDIEALLNQDLTDNNVTFNPIATGGATVEAGSEADLSALAKALETISNVLKTKHDTAKNSINNVR